MGVELVLHARKHINFVAFLAVHADRRHPRNVFINASSLILLAAAEGLCGAGEHHRMYRNFRHRSTGRPAET